jgi:hypothetical protein
MADGISDSLMLAVLSMDAYNRDGVNHGSMLALDGRKEQ